MATKKRPQGKREVSIKSRRTAFKGRYRIEEVIFDFDRVSGPSGGGKGRIENSKREIFERGDSVAALLHDIERDVIIVTEQFRISTYDKGPGYILEAMAGSVEEGEDPEDCLRREMMEEIGYQAGKVTFIGKPYVSPGSSSERIFLYYVPVKPSDLVDPSASGLAAEKEDIGRTEFTREEFLKRLDAGKFDDGKILTLGFWLKAQPKQGKPAKVARTVKSAKAKPKSAKKR
jgi:nudix-type nucleoside diphosphatase (YffH/AdpP family)